MDVLRNNGKPATKKRFVKGGAAGPGRPKGSPNKSTLDARQLRTAILESWDRVDGGRLLDELARKDPHAYLKLVVSILPRNVELEVDAEDRPLTIAGAVLLLEQHDRENGRGRMFGNRSVHVPELASDQASD